MNPFDLKFDHAGRPLLVDNDPDATPIWLFTTFVFAASIILTSLYNSSGGSVLLAVLFHAAFNATELLTDSAVPAAEEFNAHAPDRLSALPFLPTGSPEEATAEFERCVQLEYLRLSLPVRFHMQFVSPRDKTLALERRGAAAAAHAHGHQKPEGRE